MKIGQWRERILIQKNTITKDRTGNQKNVWEDYYSCYAYANNLSGKEYWGGGGTGKSGSLSLFHCAVLQGTGKYGQHPLQDCVQRGNLQYHVCGFHAVSEENH